MLAGDKINHLLLALFLSGKIWDHLRVAPLEGAKEADYLIHILLHIIRGRYTLRDNHSLSAEV